jgi:cbb3-type cytochrome oxidase maturation protein
VVVGLGCRLGYGIKLPAGGTERPALGTKHFYGAQTLMDILYLLIPLSVTLVFFILAGLWWAIDRGQFDDIEAEGERILKD